MDTPNTKIWLSSPHMGGQEMKYIQEAFAQNWIAPIGPNLDHFESGLGNYLGVKHVAALSSGTAAIHLALILLQVKAGDIVLCQSLTFAASANPITYLGATPAFLDSELDTWNICPEALETAIVHFSKKGIKPKALILVHLYGMPARLSELLAICQKYEIPVIEDAAEALGSKYNNTLVGGFGDLGILSFNGNKIITTSGGGALLSNREEYINNAKFLATQARDPAVHYEHSQIGYNYRMSNILAGIGRGQLEVIEERVSQRRSHFEYYKKALSEIGNIAFQPEPDNCKSNRWLSVFTTLDSNIDINKIQNALMNENIETRPIWKPMHLQPVFKDAPYFGGTNAENLFQTGMCLPSGSNLTDVEKERVTIALRKQL